MDCFNTILNFKFINLQHDSNITFGDTTVLLQFPKNYFILFVHDFFTCVMQRSQRSGCKILHSRRLGSFITTVRI